jgi:tetratricopeptide (TPR) repeat protein
LNLAQKAEDDLQQSIERLQRSLKEHPQDATLRQGLARSQINLGVLLDETNRLKAANEEYLKAIGLLTELEKRYPKNVEYRFELATLLMNRANLLLKESSRSELGMKDTLVVADESYRLSVDKLRVLSAQFSNVPRYRNELANSLNGLGVVQLQLGNKEEAKVAWTEAMTELQSLVSRSPNVAVYRYQLALTANNLAYLHRRAADVTELEMRRVSVEQQRKATDLSPTNTLYCRKLLDFESIFARVLLENGKHTDAASVAEELAGRSGDDSATVYAAAKILAQCAVVAAKDTQLTETQIKEQTLRYRSKATALLADCQKKGLPVKPEDFPGLDW